MDFDEKNELHLIDIDEVKELKGTPTAPLESKDVDLNKTVTAHLENKVKELHSNVRHITQLGMTWFAFFVTINYLTIGWLAKGPSSGSESIHPLIIGTVAAVFILQNILGIIGILKVRDMAKAGAAQVSVYENWLLSVYETWLREKDNMPHIKVLKCRSVPASLYSCIARSLVMVLGTLILAWVIIWVYYMIK